MKTKAVGLDEILNRELKNNDFKLLFDEHNFYLQIAHLISDLREKTGLSQSDLAKKAAVSQPMIARLEKGDHQRTPTFDTVYKILKALGYEMSINVQKVKKKRAA